MTPQDLVRAFTKAAEDRDGAAMAALFTENAVYHDVFYGAFEGRPRIAELIDDWFYRHARDLRWDMFDPVSDGRNLYTRYVFSYVSTVPEAQGRRVMFEGVGLMRLEGGLIAAYREVANTGPALLDMGFPPERVAKILTRQGELLLARPETVRHRA
ncbi:MAG TPA: nuclear transport factor 2 family protein [Candidatus Binataceae bacterium]|nr:nuclear transport factor 2 family protein [Candidatus Binataceae bacterium]